MTTKTAPDTRKSLAAEATGLSADKIGTFRLQLRQLRQLGILIDLTCAISVHPRLYAE
jgi:hypothetical protein